MLTIKYYGCIQTHLLPKHLHNLLIHHHFTDMYRMAFTSDLQFLLTLVYYNNYK